MEKIFSISKAAKMVGMTTETLRHYDRIGLVKPYRTDEWTGYRYYSEDEIVRLNTIRALRCMEIPLREIKEMLEMDDFERVVNFLKQAGVRADRKIAELNQAKQRTERARLFYESKLKNITLQGTEVKIFPSRAILLSDSLSEPSLDNLWDYHRHFKAQLGEMKDLFSFEDVAGILERKGRKQLFAVCTKYSQVKNLEVLPEGKYLCAECTNENYSEVSDKLIKVAEREYLAFPDTILRIIVLTGILQWKYEIQLFIGQRQNKP